MSKGKNTQAKLEIIEVRADTLKPSTYNPRKWNEETTKRLTESIQKFGLVDPILANSAKGRENIVIGGHFSIKIAKDLKFKTVSVAYLNILDESSTATAL